MEDRIGSSEVYGKIKLELYALAHKANSRNYITCGKTCILDSVTCPHHMWHCSWSLGPDGLDCADHINLSLCLHLLNQRPNGYECTSAAQTITACGERYIQIVHSASIEIHMDT